MLSLSVGFAHAENEEIYKQLECLFVGDWISVIILYGMPKANSSIYSFEPLRFPIFIFCF